MEGVTLFLFVIGLGLLIAGAEALVRGAARLAAAFGVSPLVIGLTIVAFGTSAPELAVSVQSALAGRADIAVGNVIGSNIFNVLFILGASALIVPLVVARQLVRLDVPIMIGVSVLVWLFSLDLNIGRLEGLILVAGIAMYTAFQVVQSRREQSDAREHDRASKYSGVLVNIAFVAAGLGMLVVGSRWLVDGAVAIARAIGIEEVVIGLTIVAAGTSLPEVATSILAAIRGERDIAVGNVVGSNVFNILAVLGLSGIAAPGGLSISPSVLHFDIWVMIAVAVACLPIFFTGWEIRRWEGAVFLGYYVAYTVYLIFEAAGNPALPVFGHFLLLFIVPMTIVILAAALFREWRRHQATHSLDH